MRTGFLALWIASVVAAQQPEPSVKFTASANLVIVNVSVRDRSGAPVEGLRKDDFEILEDGKGQTISVFEFQRLSGENKQSRTRVVARPTGPAAAITPSAPGQIRYRDRRLIVLFFDFSSMEPPEQIRAQEAALKFVNEQMQPVDLVAVMAFSNRLRVLEDFTDDRERLTARIRGLRIGDSSELAAEASTGGEEEGEDTGAAFTADDTEFNIFNTDRKLSALATAARMLASLPEKKALVYFSGGVGRTGVENQSQLLATINAAVRANVAFYTVDARGLTAAPPGGAASQASPRGTAIFTGAAQRQQRERFANQQETLVSLATETGGKALLDTNDLVQGIIQAQRDMDSYYILGYYSTNPALDGRFRRIQVRLKAPLQARLDYRRGYFAAKDFSRFSAADRERQLEEALLLGDPVTDLALALEVDYFRLARDRYFVPVTVKIPASQVQLARKGETARTEFDFIGQVRDARGSLAAAVRDTIRVQLAPDQAGGVETRHFQYDTGFTLPPGSYTLRFLARENMTGKMGTFETRFTVPDLSAESAGVRMSSVVWGHQREPLQEAVGAAEKRNRLLARHPLVQEGKKLVPSITRVFRRDQNLYVYFEVYDPARASGGTASVAANLSFFRGRTKALETEPVRVTRSAQDHMGPLRFQFELPLRQLSAGRYVSQVNVVDELGRKFAFVRSPLVILP
jgi:VWFA-related protein